MRSSTLVGPILALLTCTTALPLAAQGTVQGQVVDSVTRQGLAGATVSIQATMRTVQTGPDGKYAITGVPAGAVVVRVTLIGFAPQQQNATVSDGASAEANFSLAPQASILEPVVVTGYGSQRREAITGSVSTVDGGAANVGVVTNSDQMLRARAAGVDVIQNNGEPGAGAVVLIRGGSSISASNQPLYVVDGVPLNSVPTEPPSYGVGGSPPLPRNPLNLISPAEIASITVLKDASAAAIYGSRAANGVILIETKKGNAAGGGSTLQYDGYVSASSAAQRLNTLSAGEYSAYINDQVGVWRADSTACRASAPCNAAYTDSAKAFDGLTPSHLSSLGTANTDWSKEVLRTAFTTNHDLSFIGGNDVTHYRASLNYMNQEGVTLVSGFQRTQGSLSAATRAFDNRLGLGVNVATSRGTNTYVTFENRGGFEGGIFQNVAIFNPTQPVTVTDALGTTSYYEPGGTSVRNPVALAEQITDVGQTNRTIANANAELQMGKGFTGKITIGLDGSSGGRQIYYPLANPVGVALGNGKARQYDLDNRTRTFQGLLTYQGNAGSSTTLDIVGGYEYTNFKSNLFMAEGTGFFTDAFKYYNLGAATSRTDSSFAEEWKLASFFTRANVGLSDRFFLTGILRYDGSSRWAEGNQWGVFPGLSASWNLSSEGFASSLSFSELKLRAGWGRVGNPGVPAYASLRLVSAGTNGTYPWGDAPQTGVTLSRNPNPDLRWEKTSQANIALDFARGERFAGTVEYYVKNTSDLLLEVPVPAPAEPSTRIENVGEMRNNGLEITLNTIPTSKPSLTWRSGLVFSTFSNKVLNLGPHSSIRSGVVSGQGQSDVWAQRILPGEPLGTFYGPVYIGLDAQGRQLFQCAASSTGCLSTTVAGSDFAIIGNANPDFTLGWNNTLTWNRFNFSFLIRAVVGNDVFNNTSLVYASKGNALQDKNFLKPALDDGAALHEPSVYSSRWIEDGSFVRLQNITLEYDLSMPALTRWARSAKLYVSADNVFLITGYSGLDPEVNSNNEGNPGDVGLQARGIDYLSYPRSRVITGGLRLVF
ncbi:MAG: SusC/RagA family TonB-linked outer membrane protein [Acidobacteriota bacterium]